MVDLFLALCICDLLQMRDLQAINGAFFISVSPQLYTLPYQNISEQLGTDDIFLKIAAMHKSIYLFGYQSGRFHSSPDCFAPGWDKHRT